MNDGIVITGSAIVNGLGCEPGEVFAALCDGRSAVAPIRQWDSAGWPHRFAAEIAELDPRALIADRKTLKLLRRSHVLGLYAGAQAIEAAGWLAQREHTGDADAFNDRSALYVGSGGSAFQDQYDY